MEKVRLDLVLQHTRDWCFGDEAERLEISGVSIYPLDVNISSKKSRSFSTINSSF